MPRIVGVDLKDNWKVDYALTKIKGIGWSHAKKTIQELNIDSSKRISDLTPDQISQITTFLEKYETEGDLLRKLRNDIQRLKEIGSYRGMRHSRGLPARGQRTRSNARTKRGKRKTVGAFRKEALAKMTQTKKEA